MFSFTQLQQYSAILSPLLGLAILVFIIRLANFARTADRAGAELAEERFKVSEERLKVLEEGLKQATKFSGPRNGVREKNRS
jgi:hypothetical protein